MSSFYSDEPPNKFPDLENKNSSVIFKEIFHIPCQRRNADFFLKLYTIYVHVIKGIKVNASSESKIKNQKFWPH